MQVPISRDGCLFSSLLCGCFWNRYSLERFGIVLQKEEKVGFLPSIIKSPSRTEVRQALPVDLDLTSLCLSSYSVRHMPCFALCCEAYNQGTAYCYCNEEQTVSSLWHP